MRTIEFLVGPLSIFAVMVMLLLSALLTACGPSGRVSPPLQVEYTYAEDGQVTKLRVINAGDVALTKVGYKADGWSRWYTVAAVLPEGAYVDVDVTKAVGKVYRGGAIILWCQEYVGAARASLK